MLKLKEVVATVARNEVELCIAFVKKVIIIEFERNIAPNDSARKRAINNCLKRGGGITLKAEISAEPKVIELCTDPFSKYADFAIKSENANFANIEAKAAELPAEHISDCRSKIRLKFQCNNLRRFAKSR